MLDGIIASLKKKALFLKILVTIQIFILHILFFLNDCNKDYIISKTDYGFQFISGIEKIIYMVFSFIQKKVN